MEKMLGTLYALREKLEGVIEDIDTLDIPQNQLSNLFRFTEALEASLDLLNTGADVLDTIITETTEEGYDEQFGD